MPGSARQLLVLTVGLLYRPSHGWMDGDDVLGCFSNNGNFIAEKSNRTLEMYFQHFHILYVYISCRRSQQGNEITVLKAKPNEIQVNTRFKSLTQDQMFRLYDRQLFGNHTPH